MPKFSKEVRKVISRYGTKAETQEQTVARLLIEYSDLRHSLRCLHDIGGRQ